MLASAITYMLLRIVQIGLVIIAIGALVEYLL